MRSNRLNDCMGNLDQYVFPGGYELLYVTPDGEIVCAECANGARSSEWTPHSLVRAFIHWEGPPITCQGCDTEKRSEYGDPDEPRYPEIRLDIDLSGPDGNAHFVLGKVVEALYRCECKPVEVDKYIGEATRDDYDNLLRVTRRWINLDG